MKALPCLLLLLTTALRALELPTPPQNLPIVYPQPVGHCFILRVDNRRYELADDFKEPVARLLGGANYAQTKSLFDDLKRTIAERVPLETAVTRAQSALNLATAKVEKSRATVDALRQKRTLYRTSEKLDLQELLRLDNAIVIESANLARYEDMEERAQQKLADAQKAVIPYNEKVQAAQDKYVAALKEYDRTLGELRALAIANGKAL
jgi:hypothetical protein